jgi:hypothetical protein
LRKEDGRIYGLIDAARNIDAVDMARVERWARAQGCHLLVVDPYDALEDSIEIMPNYRDLGFFVTGHVMSKWIKPSHRHAGDAPPLGVARQKLDA